MATRKKTTAATAGSANLNQPPADAGTGLLIRNISKEIYTVAADRPEFRDFVLHAQEENVFPKEYASNRNLRKVADSGALVFEWVGPDFQPRVLPRIDEAPDELVLGLNDFEKQFAMHIATSNDQADVTALITDTKARRAGSQNEDLKYTKDKLRQILKLAEWLEKKIQNRPAVLAAIDQRVDSIRAL